MRYTIHVEQEDIGAGRLFQGRGVGRASLNCPVAHALRRQGFPKASVGISSFKVDDRDPPSPWVNLPESVPAFIHKFDAREMVDPFTFEFDYEERSTT